MTSHTTSVSIEGATAGGRYVLSKIFTSEPGPVAGVEGHCSVVVWNEPKEPNGRILNYTLVFIPNTGDDDLEIQTADDRTSYVIRPGFLLPEGGGLYIQVYKSLLIYHYGVMAVCVPLLGARMLCLGLGQASSVGWATCI